MLAGQLRSFLYQGNESCLHLPQYEIRDYFHHKQCGPCFIRSGFIYEHPSQVTMRSLSDAGTPEWNPNFNGHLLVVIGLIAPEPGEPLWSFQKRRAKFSKPTMKLFPITSALWKLMGHQPPLAIPMVEFCQGYSELDIAAKHDWSLWNVQDRLAKAARAALRNVRT